MKRTVIALDGVSKAFNDVQAVQSVNLDINKGERFVLLGRNGSGKSTLLRIVATVMEPNEGRVEILGMRAPLLNPSIRKQMGVVFDHTSHWDKLTGYENATFFASMNMIKKEELDERLGYLFKWIDLWKDKDKPVSAYSYGMRRKLAIIEALAHRPSLLLLDEPSIGLDSPSLNALNALLIEESANGTTIVLTTNDLHEALAVGERIGLMKHGKLEKILTNEELIRGRSRVVSFRILLASPWSGSHNISNLEGVLNVKHSSDNRNLAIDVEYKESEGQSILAHVIDDIARSGGTILRIEVSGLEDLLSEGG